VEVGTSCQCRADALARLSEALDPRPQNCIRDTIDIQELQAHSSLRSPPDRRKDLYFLFLLRKSQADPRADFWVAVCTHKTPTQGKIGSHAPQAASHFEVQYLRRYREGIAGDLTPIQETSDRNRFIESKYHKQLPAADSA
jgi:hypothetical protein